MPRRTLLRTVLGAPARALLDRRIAWIVAAMDERFARAEGRFDALDAELARQRLALAELRAPGTLATLTTRGAGLEHLDQGTAELLGWAEGPQGVAAQAGLWFNPPVPVSYRAGGAEVMHVTERIVEPAWVFAALAGRPPGLRVLDAGGSESTVALSLAALGHRVTVADPRGYPVEHPALEVAACRLDELPGRPFDAVVALSAIEHFGLGHYGDAPAEGRADLDAMADFARRLAPDGLLVLTVPMGAPRVDGFQRVYDAAGVDELLDGWRVHERALVARRSPTVWERAAWPDWDGGEAVALVTASPAAAQASRR